MSRRSKAKGNRILEKRVKQLEKELREGRTHKKKSRAKSPSSSESSSSELDSDEGSLEPRRRHRRSRSSSSESSRGRRRNRSRSSDRSKKEKYDRKRQMEKGDVIENSQMLLVYLVRLLRRCYKRGKPGGWSY